jgi:DHA1 family bicyclomycin/chloramphenicol resistance-like MFS transporter
VRNYHSASVLGELPFLEVAPELCVLDMFPANRGSAASVQTFVQLLVASAIIGLVAPAIHGSMLWLTFGSMVAAIVAAILYSGAARVGSARPRVVA